jgi:predicted nucleic acid-binding protein
VLVLDTSFIIAFHNRRDVHHGGATAVMERFLDGEWEGGLLLEYVLLEVATVVQAKVDHPSALEVVDRLLGASELKFLPCSELFLPTLETFRTQGSRGLSFVDSAIATAARRHPPGFVATFDRGFGGVPGVSPIGL